MKIFFAKKTNLTPLLNIFLGKVCPLPKSMKLAKYVKFLGGQIMKNINPI